MIPTGVPTVLRVVKNGRGGPNGDSIPVYDKPTGTRLGYLKNGVVIAIVNPSYGEASRYRPEWNGSVYPYFRATPDFPDGGCCEENSHLYPLEPTSPEQPSDAFRVEILGIETNYQTGKRYATVRKV